MNRMAAYRNGNYTVELYEDGTKIRTLDEGETEFIAAFPESIDLKITNCCNKGCPQCHECSTPDGAHGDILAPFLATLHPYTEIALGGGNVLEHPQYVTLLEQLKDRHIFVNITLHQTHVAENMSDIKRLIKERLIRGLGISFNGNITELERILVDLDYEHIVVHVINGIITLRELQAMSRMRKVPKILILGYKTFGRGVTFYDTFSDMISQNQKAIQQHIHKILLNFPVVSFDNLALEQIDLSNVITPEEYERFYMGDDGEHTMYVDLVKKQFARNSRSNIRYHLEDDIDTMFEVIREEGQYDKTNY